MDNFGKISDNAAGFTKSLMALADYAEKSFEKVVRKACIDLFRKIAERTPVDTGRAKASWGISTVEMDYTAEERKYEEQELIEIINQEAKDFSAERIGDQVVIYNNLEYIEALENGHSIKQAPAGMVSVSLAEFENHFNNALHGLQGLEPA